MELYLIRHGESEGNISGNVYGDTDYPLTSKGEKQARIIRDYFRNKTLDYVFTSPLVRAKVIGEGIASDHGLEATLDSQLKEMNFGIFEDMRVEFVKEKLGYEGYVDLINPFSDYEELYADDHVDFRRRVNNFYLDLLEAYGDTDAIIVVTAHLGVLRVLSSVLLEYKAKHMLHYKFEPGCIVRFQIKEGFGKLVELIQTI